ncbi:MAG: PilN domain-containing protein [Polyangiaceae bacterium]|jgi:type IV pilus assembly protein PilN
MIRINLLPEKRAAQRRTAAAEGQAWIAIVVGVLIFEIIMLMLLQKSKNDELAKLQKHNQEVQANIDDIKRQISNRDAIKAQLKELRDREDAIQKLESARTGPTSVMLELSHILTPGRMPTVDRDKLEQLKRDNPQAVPNVNWDARRLWLLSYDEVDRNVHLTGLARDGEDVSEFLRRLALSDFFYDVKMLPAAKSVDNVSHVELVRFELSTKVRY